MTRYLWSLVRFGGVNHIGWALLNGIVIFTTFIVFVTTVTYLLPPPKVTADAPLYNIVFIAVGVVAIVLSWMFFTNLVRLYRWVGWPYPAVFVILSLLPATLLLSWIFRRTRHSQAAIAADKEYWRQWDARCSARRIVKSTPRLNVEQSARQMNTATADRKRTPTVRRGS